MHGTNIKLKIGLFLADSLTILLLLLAYDLNVVLRDKTYLIEPVIVGTKRQSAPQHRSQAETLRIKQ
jgi:hypothetical protein